MALTKKQLGHLEKRLLDERERALKALGLFDKMTKADRESGDSDLAAYTDHMADQGTEAMEREKAAIFATKEGPCYRCLYPTQPPEELAPACAVAGVLGVLPGIIGLLQTNEVIKLVLGVGETLAGRMLLFDAMTTSFDEIRLWRDPACPACGDAAAKGQARTAAATVVAAAS